MRRVRRPFLALAAGAIVFAAAVSASLRADTVAASASSSSAAVAQQPARDTGNYVGPGSCSAVACHGAIRAVPGANILQTEYSTWIAMDRHARATEVLGNTLSQRMARHPCLRPPPPTPPR